MAASTDFHIRYATQDGMDNRNVAMKEFYGPTDLFNYDQICTTYLTSLKSSLYMRKSLRLLRQRKRSSWRPWGSTTSSPVRLMQRLCCFSPKMMRVCLAPLITISPDKLISFLHTLASPAGIALYFHNYSTWRAAPGIWLEDLFVREKYRGRGYGTALITALAREVEKINGGRLEWSVLKWNIPSINF